MQRKNRSKTKELLHIQHHVAERLRIIRLDRGLTQIELADRLGVVPQVIYYYEKQQNRINAGRLKQLADVLGVTPNDFYVGLEPGEGETTTLPIFRFERLDLDLLRTLANLPNNAIKRTILHLVRLMIGEQDGSSAG
jgi:transcriptional regulator with XRE-family HTH domain